MTIEEICKNKDEAYQKYQAYSHMNVSPSDTTQEHRIEVSIGYAKAQAEYLKWSRLYDNKIQEMAA